MNLVQQDFAMLVHLIFDIVRHTLDHRCFVDKFLSIIIFYSRGNVAIKNFNGAKRLDRGLYYIFFISDLSLYFR